MEVEEVAKLLRKLNGNMAAVARQCGVTRQAVWAFVARHPELREVASECRESMKDEAESALYKAVKRGESWAVCFYLKCQAKDRGYVERVEVREADDGDLDTEIDRTFSRLAAHEANGAAGAPEAPAVPR